MCRDKNQNRQPEEQSSVKCPFSIRPLNDSTYLIRENDSFGEHPHIYAKICTTANDQGMIVLSDTGVGTTNADNTTLWTFLASTINKSNLPYLVILSHCHYDHILGLRHPLPSSKHAPTIAASSYQPSFVTPYSHLQEHSLCTSYDLPTPKYTVSIWAGDGDALRALENVAGLEDLDLGITTLHTPGHTPDSLSFYDAHTRTLFVGDSFYALESEDSRGASWGREGELPIIFPKEGDLKGWWGSLERLRTFVATENAGAGGDKVVKLSAGHVTAGVDAAEFLDKVKAFMSMILRGDIPCKEQEGEKRGLKMGFWREGGKPEFSLVAPLRLIEHGREKIPRKEWE